MNDLISRQAAIDALNLAYTNTEVVNNRPVNDCEQELYYRIRRELSKLPSAQTETHDKRTETHACDLIKRQQAIDALDKHIDTFDAIDTNYLCGLRTAMSILKEMPSAQQDDRLNKIAELVDGTIYHFDRDDAMDLLYQIKEVLK